MSTTFTMAHMCPECNVLHPPFYECRVKDWKSFFEAHAMVGSDMERMFQCFKLRLMHEIGVRTWDDSGPHDNGELIERKP